jgi:hypothetical protein
LKLFQQGGKEGIREDDGGGEFNYNNIIRTFLNATMYPQHNKKILNQYTMKIKINISDHEKKK